MYLIIQKIDSTKSQVYVSSTFDVRLPIARWQLPNGHAETFYEVLTQLHLIDSEGFTEAPTLINKTIISLLKELP